MRPASAAAVVLTVLVAGSRGAPQPQFGGLKKLISSFSGDEEAGEGNDGDYQSVPYETIQTFDVSPKTSNQEGIYYKWASVKMTLKFHFLWSTLF